MIYKKFYIQIILQVVLLATTPVLFWFVYLRDYMVVTSYSLIALWVFQIAYLIYYINKTNRDLSRFFNAFQYQDSSLVFNEHQNEKAFQDLHQSFNGILNAFGKVKIEKEKDFVFFQHTLNLVGIGLLAFDQKGDIKLCNTAFKELFGEDGFSNIRDLDAIENSFPAFLMSIKSGSQKLRKYLLNKQILKLAIKAVDFRLENELIKVVAFQDIKNAIDKGEMDAMHKLIRVFSHEILNSVSPIAMLSGSLLNLYEKNRDQEEEKVISEEDITNTLMGLQTIRKRSKGLMAFVDEYRNLTQLPKPQFKSISLPKLFMHIETLFSAEFKTENIEFTYQLQGDNQELIADEKLISQVLINLIRNSIDAVKGIDYKKISIVTDLANPAGLIVVSDNGVGISDELIEHIFTPFFTTKEKGSGIGLNLSRQILQLHGGSISVRSQANKLTEFSLKF